MGILPASCYLYGVRPQVGRLPGIVVALLVVGGAVAAPARCLAVSYPTAATPPGPGAPRPRTRISVVTWNDHTTASYNGVSLAWGAKDIDGNDVGYTYGFGAMVERTRADGLTWTGLASSKLYLRETGDPPSAEGSVPVWYTEEDEVSLAADTRARGLPWYWRLGGGFFFDNKERNFLGSLRQQQQFHEFFRSRHLNQYQYRNPGGEPSGLFVIAGVGAQAAGRVGAKATASGSVEISAQPNTHADASLLVQAAEARIAAPWGPVLLEAALRGEATLHDGGVGVAPELMLALSYGRWSLASAIALPRGELPNHVRYNDDQDPIATLTLSVAFD
jgi:hypothetical protein